MNIKITIFTPTYNRGYILPKAYRSLLNQTSKEFEWIIVDDGSTDNTKQIVANWILEDKIEIKYIYQENSGKPKAHNRGVQEARCDLFLCLDSDDQLSENAVETLLKSYNAIKEDDRYTGIIAYRDIKNVKMKFKKIKVNFLTLEELNYKYKYNYDLLLAYKTKYLRKFPFPIIDNEKFIQESYVYNQIDTLGKMLLIKEKLYIGSYLEDGYSKNINEIIKSNPKGYKLCAKQKMELAKFIIPKIKGAIRYTIGGLLTKDYSYIKNVRNVRNKLILLMVFPISYYVYVKKYKRG